MLTKISDYFWIDFADVYLVLPTAEDAHGLEVYYRSRPSFTRIPLDLVNPFLYKLHLHFGEDMKDVWGPTT